jgi:hypothetical protein
VRVGILTVEYPSRASYYQDWRDAIASHPGIDAETVNLFHAVGRRRAVTLSAEAELLVLLHACTADTLDYVEPIAGALAARRGKLVAFVGNELNLPWAPMAAKIRWLKQASPDIIATQLLAEAGAWLYAETGARVVALPHALNPAAFRPGPPTASRPIEIGGRSFRYSPYLGDDDRNRLFDAFAALRLDPPLKADLSHEHRFDRDGWAAFLARCQGTIATEAGGWFLERDDRTVLAISAWLKARAAPGIEIPASGPIARLGRMLPWRLKQMLQPLLSSGLVRQEALAGAHFAWEAVRDEFFIGRARAPVYAKCISSRHFDAIGTGTVQIMFPGRFNDILRPHQHYLPLAEDLSDLRDVMERFRDPTLRARIADAALVHVLAAHTYRHRVEAMLAAL